MSNPYVEQELERIKKKLKLLSPQFKNAGKAKIGTLLVTLTDLKDDALPQEDYAADENDCHRGYHHNR
ncbi:hypothetical protein [Maridesulfovibrio sp.]|uniref:hypothetical protein n=1 Tax=Maridesulfovibrio sp. TaxID=2795000 RepID=UPI003B00CEEE